MKILLAVDGSSYSAAAVAEVARRPWPEGTEVMLLTVDPPVEGGLLATSSPTVFDELVAQQRREAQTRLNNAAAVLATSVTSFKVLSVLLDGLPKDLILREAESWGADLIVVGSHGYGAIQRLFLGSVSLAVATNAPCSVLIVRSPLLPEDSAQA